MFWPFVQVRHSVLGKALLVFGVGLYLYYTAWILLTPFAEPGHPVQNFFPSRVYGLALPTIGIILLLSVTAGLAGVLITLEKLR
mmetsp:Transcript_10432/g.13036  ORF Transcript_10432/g.13036 Transcript_10432/m.13036 type:complete len:84 (-) Transcript_10432:2512-2763(-)